MRNSEMFLYWVILKYATTHNHLKPLTTMYNHPKNNLQQPKIIDNHPQPQEKLCTTSHNHPQSPKSYPKKPKLVTSSYVTAL